MESQPTSDPPQKTIRAYALIGNAGFPMCALNIDGAGLRIHKGILPECEAAITQQLGHQSAMHYVICGNTLELRVEVETTNCPDEFVVHHGQALRRMTDLISIIALSDLRRCLNHSPTTASDLFANASMICVTTDLMGSAFVRGIAQPHTLSCKHVPEIKTLDSDAQATQWKKVVRHLDDLRNCRDPKTLIAFAMSRTCFSISPRNSVLAAARLNLLVSALEALLIDPAEHTYIWRPEVKTRLEILIGNVPCSSLDAMDAIADVRHHAAHRAGRDKDGKWSIDKKTLTTVENWLRWALMKKLNEAIEE